MICYNTTTWDDHFFVLDAFGRFFLANMPSASDLQIASDEWPKLKRAFHQMSDLSFYDFCQDVQEEMARRDNDLRDGLFHLPSYDNVPLGRNQTRQKLSTISSQRFHSLCIRICLELERRSLRPRLKQPARGTSKTHLETIPLHEDNPQASQSPTSPSDLLDNWNGEDLLLSDSEFLAVDSPIDRFDATITAIYSVLVSIFQDRDRYAALLSYRGNAAQQILDLLQMLLDHPTTTFPVKNGLLTALMRLSFQSGLYPRAFTLSGISRGDEPVASGSFGEIWQGDFHGQPVCLKIARVYQNQTSSRERLVQAFSREAILWGHISHPNLLPFYGIYHLDDDHGRICLVSPWMEHGNVHEYLEKYPDASRHLLISDVAVGMQYLHGRGIVHSDLKGANILIDDSGRACVADFGLSRVLDSAMAVTSSLSGSVSFGGTVRWQAPELFDPSVECPPATMASDVYAFGCVCYEIFTGRVPFYHLARDASVILKVMQGERPLRPALTDAPFTRFGLEKHIWDLMEECWDRSPSLRPAMDCILHRLPLGDTMDSRPCLFDWEELPASRFRTAVYKSDCLSINVLETVLSWM